MEGDYEKAKEILLAHRFHTYEGGEGNLTQHHAWLYFLQALALQKLDDVPGAKAALLDGLVFPENYGEEKNYFVNDAPIYLALSGPDSENAEKYLQLALSTNGAPTVHSYYQCLALYLLGRKDEDLALADALKQIGESKLRHAAVNDYYGVGAPAYPPFGYDIVKAHTTDGLIFCAFAALARKDTETAQTLAAQIEKLDACHFFLCLLRKILGNKAYPKNGQLLPNVAKLRKRSFRGCVSTRGNPQKRREIATPVTSVTGSQ